MQALVNEYNPCEKTGILTAVTVGDEVMFYRGGYEQHGVVDNVFPITTPEQIPCIAVKCEGYSGVTIKAATDCYAGNGDIWTDYTDDQYEQALTDNGFTREGAMTGFHVRTQDQDGNWFNINEGAAQDMFDTRREVLVDLIATRNWEANS